MRTGLFDEGGEALQVGGRIGRNFTNGLSFGGNFDWASVDNVDVATFGGLNASLLLYSAEIGYRFPVTPRATFFLAGGAGAATLRIEDPPPGVAQSSMGLLFPVGGGIKIHNRAAGPSWAFRLDMRDNLILLETGEAVAGESQTEPRHNFEVSAGFSFLFGREEEVAPVDTDRDGVLDPADWCLNRPGEAVDSRGCPVDRDQDGVPNQRDACPETEVGARVDERGCPTEAPERLDADPEAVLEAPAPAGPEPRAETPAPADPEPRAGAPPAGDADGDGVSDARDLCPGTPVGIQVDERGCLARPAVAPDGLQAPRAGPAVVPPPRTDERQAGESACLGSQSWFVARQQIEFDNRRFELIGVPLTVDAQYLLAVGTFDGVPLYASTTDRPPYTDLWLPRCGTEGLYELYVQIGSRP